MKKKHTEKNVGCKVSTDTTSNGDSGCAIVFLVEKQADAKAILDSEKFKAAGGIAIFRQSIAVVNVGIFIALLSFLALIPAEETLANWLIKMMLIVGIGGLGLYLILNGLVSRVYLEPERLMYRNFCGIKKAILWRDIQNIKDRTVRSGNGIYQYLLISGMDTKIKISWSYIAYSLLKSEIKKRWKQNKNK